MAPQVMAHPGTRTKEDSSLIEDKSSASPRTTTDPNTRAGDPLAYAGERDGCPACYQGVVYIGIEEAGEETYEAVPCRRCAPVR
jgi:hypothetical protein